MQLHGYSPKTQSCYVGAVRGLAKFYHKSPDQVSEEELRRYFLHLTLEKKVARATATIALCGIKFLFQNTLQRSWTSLKLLKYTHLPCLPPLTISNPLPNPRLTPTQTTSSPGYHQQCA